VTSRQERGGAAMRDDWFEWDDAKAKSNLESHGISFDFARQAFDDPNWIDVEGPDPDEERYNRICMLLCMLQGRLITVTYVERAHRIRIISACMADIYEQRKYFGR
jgi:uncharacterized DUF497 family protein